MKRHFIYLCSALSFSLINAQEIAKPIDTNLSKPIIKDNGGEEPSKKLRYHVSAGTTISDLALGFRGESVLNDPLVVDYRYKSNIGFGYYVGANVGYPLNGEGLSLEGGIKFIQLFGSGTADYVDNNQGTDDVSLKSSLLNIPIGIKQSFSIAGVNCYGKLSGYIGFILSNEYKVKPDQTSINAGGTAATVKYKDNSGDKTIDYGLIGELGAEVYKGLSINVSYNLGLQNLYDGVKRNSTDTNDIDSENNYFRYFTLGLSYDLGL